MTRPHEFLMNTHTQRAQRAHARPGNFFPRLSSMLFARPNLFGGDVQTLGRPCRDACRVRGSPPLAMGLFCPRPASRVGVSKSRRVTGLFPSAPTSSMPMGAPPVGDTAAGELGRDHLRAAPMPARPRPIFSIRASMPPTPSPPRVAGRPARAGGGGRSGAAIDRRRRYEGTAAAGGDGGVGVLHRLEHRRSRSSIASATAGAAGSVPRAAAGRSPPPPGVAASRCSGVHLRRLRCRRPASFARAATASTSPRSARNPRARCPPAACGTRRAASPGRIDAITAAAWPSSSGRGAASRGALSGNTDALLRSPVATRALGVGAGRRARRALDVHRPTAALRG